MQPDDPPWSPYPVQDWSALPEDPLSRSTGASPDGGPPALDPGWGPPTGRPLRDRPVWLPYLALAVALLLVTGGAVALARDGGARPSPWAPEDGSVVYEQVAGTRELRTAVTPVVTESARLSGVSGLLAVDATFGAAMLPAVGRRETVQLWRTVSTPLNDPATTAQTVRLYDVDDGVALLGESGPDAGYAFDPALVELPGDVQPGQAWEGAGSAGPALDYRSRLTAAEAEGGCLRVTGQLAYTSKQGQPARTVSRDRTWCPGDGLVASADSFADLATTIVRTGVPAPGPVRTTDQPVTWHAPESWTGREFSTISIDPVFGQEAMSGSPAEGLSPVRTASGLVVRALSGSNDLVAFTPKTRAAWTSVWRAHPGGSILAVAALGDVVVATTSRREVVGYAATGVRLWQFGLTELAPSPPVRLDDGRAVLVDLSGRVHSFDLATGRIGWQAGLDADVRLPPVVGGGAVVVCDGGGRTTALDAATGAERWSVELAGSGAAVPGSGTVVVLQDQTLHALDLADGRRRWVRPVVGTLRELAVLGDRLVVATANESVLVGPDGTVLGRWPAARRVTVGPDTAVLWGADRAVLVKPDGRTTGGWQLPPLTDAFADRRAVALQQGVWLASPDWTFQVWDDAG